MDRLEIKSWAQGLQSHDINYIQSWIFVHKFPFQKKEFIPEGKKFNSFFLIQNISESLVLNGSHHTMGAIFSSSGLTPTNSWLVGTDRVQFPAKTPFSGGTSSGLVIMSLGGKIGNEGVLVLHSNPVELSKEEDRRMNGK